MRIQATLMRRYTQVASTTTTNNPKALPAMRPSKTPTVDAEMAATTEQSQNNFMDRGGDFSEIST